MQELPSRDGTIRTACTEMLLSTLNHDVSLLRVYVNIPVHIAYPLLRVSVINPSAQSLSASPSSACPSPAPPSVGATRVLWAGPQGRELSGWPALGPAQLEAPRVACAVGEGRACPRGGEGASCACVPA